MRALFTQAWKDLIGENRQVRDALAFMCLLVMGFSAIFFPFHE